MATVPARHMVRRSLPVLAGVVVGALVLSVSPAATSSAAGDPGLGPAPPSPSSGASPLAPGRVNDDPGFFVVYNNNVENLERVDDPCPGDWKDLLYYMKIQAWSPDLFLIQQISGRQQLKALAAAMTRELAGSYGTVVAKRVPNVSGAEKCSPAKDRQTTGIIYRTGRFSYTGGTGIRWRAQRREGSMCENNDQDRTIGLAIPLRDKIAGKTIVAGTFHWPTANQQGPPCAADNFREVVKGVEVPEGSLRVFAGDANATPGGWYSQHDTLGYQDVMDDPEWTIDGGNKRRIDFLFASENAGVSADRTITFNAGDRADEQVTGADRADRSYSDHRALTAHIHY